MTFFIKIIITFLVCNTLFAKEYKIGMCFTTNIIMICSPSNNKYYHITTPVVWKDPNGDYLNFMCYGKIISNTTKETLLDLYRSAKNQENNKFWFRVRRDFLDTDAGIGISEYLDGTYKYKNFKGIKCKYAVKLFEDNSIVNQTRDVNKFNV